MFVVRTIPQLEEAIRARAREVLVIGKLAPELLELAAQPTENSDSNLPAKQRFHLAKLFEKFHVSAVYDHTAKEVVAVFQQRAEHYGGMEDAFLY